MASQMDVYPTIMGLLNIPYQNTTLGIDILKESRPYSIFNGDDKYGIINDKWFLMVRDDKSSHLYQYQSKDPKDYAKKHPEIVTKMNDYAKSNLQAYQYYLKNKN
jgi:phosphoglycerol transferase MdoB-like AlkP superfamily enzyme